MQIHREVPDQSRRAYQFLAAETYPLEIWPGPGGLGWESRGTKGRAVPGGGSWAGAQEGGNEAPGAKRGTQSSGWGQGGRWLKVGLDGPGIKGVSKLFQALGFWDCGEMGPEAAGMGGREFLQSKHPTLPEFFMACRDRGTSEHFRL